MKVAGSTVPRTSKSTKLSLSGVISVSARVCARRDSEVSEPGVSITMKSCACSTDATASIDVDDDVEVILASDMVIDAKTVDIEASATVSVKGSLINIG